MSKEYADQAPATKSVQVATFNSFQVNQTQTFDILIASHLQPNDIIVSITNPVIGSLDKQISRADETSNKCKVSFRAPIVGLYTICVDLVPALQAQSSAIQFHAKAYDLSKVFINGSSGRCRVDESYEFAVDASEAGEGRLEIAVNEGEIPNQVQVLDNGKCIVNFIPEEPVPHLVDIKFNGHNVHGCPFVVEVLDTLQQPSGLSQSGSNGMSNGPTKSGGSLIAPKKPTLTLDERIILNTKASISLENLNLDCSIDERELLVIDPEGQVVGCRLFEIDPKNHIKYDFVPSLVGDYTIELKPDSVLTHKLPAEILRQFPLSLKVFDYSKVFVTDVTDGVVGHPVYFFIDASQAGSGNLEIRVSSTTRNVPNHFQSEANANIRVNFTPTEAVDHSIDVKFNGISVPNNPFTVRVAHFPQARLPIPSRDILKFVPVGEQIDFEVEYIGSREHNNLPVEELNLKSCLVSIVGPDFTYTKVTASDLKLTKSDTKNPKFEVSFKPTKIGPYKLFITVNNELLPTCPIISNVYNVDEVKISSESLQPSSDNNSRPVVKINEPVTFSIDASRAGEGNLVLFVVSGSNKNPVHFEVKKASDKHGLCYLTFVPTELATHSINVAFNDRDAPNSPFIVEVVDIEGNKSPSAALEDQSKSAITTKTIKGERDVKELAGNFENLSVAKTTNNKTLKSSATKPKRGPVVSREDEILQSIVVHGISLKKSPVNSTGAFIIETNRLAHANDFDVFITDPGGSLVGVECYLQNDGNLLAKWTPRRVGAHNIEVLYNERHVPGSPFSAEVFDPSSVILEPPKTTVPFKTNEKIEIKLNRRDAGDSADLSLVLTSSAGKDIPVAIEQTSDDGEVITFTPEVSGIYKLSVMLEGYEVPKSPLTISVRDEIDPVKVVGSGLRCAEVRRNAQFTVDTSADGELKIRIQNADIEIVPKVEKQGESYVIKYKPTKVGYATISLYWNGVHIENSPYTVPVNDLSKIQLIDDAGSPANQLSLSYEPEVKPQITVDTTRCGPGELAAEVYCRANSNLRFTIPVTQISPGTHKLTFLCPPEPGQVPKGLSARDFSLEATYLLRFYYNNLNVPETHASVELSPVMRSNSSQPTKATPRAPQQEDNNNDNNQQNRIPAVKTTKASRFNGSSTAAERTNGDANELSTQSVDCPIVAVRGHGLVDAKCGELAEFTIDGTKACEGLPEVRFSGASDQLVDVRLEQIDKRVYRASYVAEVAGSYTVNVLWDGKQVAGCPIVVNVTGGCDPSKVICTADTLKGAVLGEEIKTFIDTRKAGPGELTALCTGPQKVAFCELLDRGDGTFILYIKPQEAGKQLLTVKYGGQHIPKSPFVIKVSGRPDPTKVRVHGPGVEHGVLSLYQSRFFCDTRGAGAGQLTVRIRGPKGAFRMETQRESQRDRTILCKYDPTEPGDYRIEIKWSGRHVPGSPFSVMIFDTQEELNRFLLSQHRNGAGSGHLGGHPMASVAPSGNNNTGASAGAKQMHPHQIPFQPTMVEYGQYSNSNSSMTKQPPYRLQ